MLTNKITEGENPKLYGDQCLL